jgi:hypothetical protein
LGRAEGPCFVFRVPDFPRLRRAWPPAAPAADSQGPIPPRLKSTPKASLPPLYLLYCTKHSDCIRRARFASASASCLHYVSALATRGGARTPRPRRRQWRRDVPRKRRPRPQPLRPRPHLTRSRRRHHPMSQSRPLQRRGKAHQCTRLRQALGSTAARGRESVRCRERTASGHFGTKTSVFRRCFVFHFSVGRCVSCFTFWPAAVFRVSLFPARMCFTCFVFQLDGW